MQILGIVWRIIKKPVREKKITYTNPMVRNSILSFTLFSKFEWTTPWWVKDAFGVNFQVPDESTTKSEREMLKFLASMYNPVGIMPPAIPFANNMYRETCDLKLSWDQRLLKELKKQRTKWIKDLPHQQFEVSRSISMYNEKTWSVTLHIFVDASSKGVCVAVYAAMDQLNGKRQGLLTS